MYTCPVCGYPELTEAPVNASGAGSYEICWSCGFEFGVTDDDAGYSFETWRQRWIDLGMPWDSDGLHPRPTSWNPTKQLQLLLDQNPGPPAPVTLIEIPSPPWLTLSVSTPSEGYDFAWRHRRSGIEARVVRGARMRTVLDFWSEFAAVMQFPPYFGHNWPAFDECMTDLEWLPARSYLVVVLDASQMLIEEPDSDYRTAAKHLGIVAEAWSEPVSQGEYWDRASVPFHFVLQVGPSERAALPERFTRVGVPLDDLPHDLRAG